MGLDVSLYKCPNLNYAMKMEQAYEAALDQVYEEWNDFCKNHSPTQQEEDEFNKKRMALKDKFEIEGYNHKSLERIRFDSKTEPEHLFKIGYMRSSYNGAGINSVANVFGLPDLYTIFEIDNEDYFQEHDWDTIYQNVKDALEKWQAHASSPAGKYWVHTFRPRLNSSKLSTTGQLIPEGITSEHEAIERLNENYLKKKEEIDKDEWRLSGWTSHKGEFYPKPLKVAAIVAGAWNPEQPLHFRNMPVTYLVCERENEDTIQWYVTALQIVQEMVEWILEHPDKDQFFTGWSG
jgi:hypothetical protein